MAVGAVLCLAAAGLTFLRPGLSGERPDEAWMEKVTPETVAGMTFRRSPDNPAQSYRMSQATYDQLKPFGIVSRVFEGKGRSYDAVVIAGDNADSFHDQRWCFESQGWEIKSDKVVEIRGEGGTYPMRQLDLMGPSGPALALFCFRGPSGQIFDTFNPMWQDFFMKELTTGRVQGGEFFRFIDLGGSDDPEGLHAFAAAFLDEALPKIDAAKAGRASP
ncbi:MAG: hypothetical protein MH204_01340 [Fimbriimonadaceae bacterium]|nr:hypothetical protein [Fimbriimonadaceae bacterium]